MKQSTVRKIGGTRRAQPAIPRRKRKTEEEKEEAKEEARYRRMEQRAHAAQLEVRCSACGEAGKILSDNVPPLHSAPPLWLVGNEWLMDAHPLCAECIEKGARAELCFEGDNLHHTYLGMNGVCVDCGHDDETEKTGEDDSFGWPDKALIQGRLEEAVAAREAAIEYLVEYLPTLPSGPTLSVLTTRLQRLCEDRNWTADRLKGRSWRTR
jgi:hypothetical protein